ncbi:MAG TPA: tetratricopeptide repeat protein [Opitutaceae bacterium]|nr:tetratricopeptide repeat protein [Opitutaceae bacterium]
MIFLVVLFAYRPAINGGFLWDDDAHVTKPELRSLEGLRRIWTELGATQQYYPLLHSAFWIEHRLWGDAVVGYHLTNILLHATAACLVVAVVRRAFNGRASPPTGHGANTAAGHTGEKYRGVPWLAGFIFALHPVGVESVAWITEQKNTLSAVFYLGSALVYLGFDRDRRESQYWLALGLFVLALLTKTVTATLPATFLVIFWWQRGRLNWRRDARPLLPWFVLGITGGLFTAWMEQKFFVSVQAGMGAHGADFALTFPERCLLAGRVIWFYLGKLVWPVDLMFIYPQWHVSAAVWWQYLYPLGLLALLAGLIVVARRHRGPLAAFLYFAGTLFPALGFFNVYPFIFSYVADHFQYLAGLGVIVPLAAGLTVGARFLLASRAPVGPRLASLGSVVLLALLGALTWRQCSMYRNVETLYRETLARNPACWLAHSNLGLILAKAPGGLPEALAHFEAAVRLKPDNAEVHNYLGSALARMPGRQAQAIAEYETALRLSPGLPYAHINLAIALMGEPGRLPEALAHLETALRIKPDSAEAHNLLGEALAAFPGRRSDAIAEFEEALRINPDFADAQSNLGIALAAIPGRMAEAISHFEAAVRLNPGSADAHYNLGYALAKIPGRIPEALVHFEAALRINPDHDGARQWINRLRATQP